MSCLGTENSLPRIWSTHPLPHNLLQHRRPDRVLRVDHVPEPHPPRLREKHIRVELVEAVVGGEPAGELAVGDAGGVFHRAAGADRHDEALVLQARPAEGPALDEVDLHRRHRRVLDGDAAELAVALGGVAVAEEEQRAGRVHRQVDDGARRHVRQVHVAAVVVRDDRGDRLDFRRGADGANERLVGQRDAVVPLDAGDGVDVHLLDDLRQRLVQHRRVAGAGEAAEFGDQAGGAGRLRPARHDLLDVDGEAVALLGALHIDRPVLRVDVGEVQHLGRQVGLGLHRAVEGVVGLRRHHRTGFYAQHRRGVGAVDIFVVALLGLGEGVMGTRLALRHAALRHDRVLEPGHPPLPQVAVPRGVRAALRGRA